MSLDIGAPPRQGSTEGTQVLDTAEQTQLRKLVRSQLPRLYRLAHRLGGEDPEELVQETMVRACRAF